MNWILLEDENQLDQIIAASNTTPQVIFKHSRRDLNGMTHEAGFGNRKCEIFFATPGQGILPCNNRNAAGRSPGT